MQPTNKISPLNKVQFHFQKQTNDYLTNHRKNDFRKLKFFIPFKFNSTIIISLMSGKQKLYLVQ